MPCKESAICKSLMSQLLLLRLKLYFKKKNTNTQMYSWSKQDACGVNEFLKASLEFDADDLG